jgi:hypothetical protein
MEQYQFNKDVKNYQRIELYHTSFVFIVYKVFDIYTEFLLYQCINRRQCLVYQDFTKQLSPRFDL